MAKPLVKKVNKRVTTQDLHIEVEQVKRDIEVIRDNHLVHIHDCIHRVESDIKENKQFFNDRLDRLDNRIWWVLGLTVTTLVAIIGAHLGGL